MATLTVRSVGLNGQGIQCAVAGARVELEGVTVSGNPGIGITISGGCELVMERSLVRDNQGGGIKINDSPFTITNNYILNNGRNNGTAGSDFGGIQISNGGTASTQLLSFNTILDNNAKDMADSRGVDCDFPTASKLQASSNILRGGTGGLDLLAGSESCDWNHSSIEARPDLVDGTTNIDDDCTSPPGADELPRLAMNSMCRERGEPSTGTNFDYDGDLRPDGMGADKPDIGADEFVPPPPPP